ncbi:hypothetical protein [Paracoccus mutanolyticus]|uniref:hypothetical protein n=1 Tax=Paracoccus mutanolyticus TaxID=1499308 RepID=UPI001CB9793F|nr:hypothetical protein [Paracoccus mutanolyticus]
MSSTMTDQSPVPARTAILPPITDPTVHTEIDRLARRYLNAGGVAMELLNAVGGKAEGLIERLPKPVRSRMDRITLAALNRAFSAASRSRGLLSDRGDWFNRALSTASELRNAASQCRGDGLFRGCRDPQLGRC